MAHSIVTPGALAFAAALGVMVLSAGIASLPPERNGRVLSGAAIMLGAWVAALASVAWAGTHGVTSLLFALDAGCGFLFYLLARPARGDAPNAVYGRNWASYVVAVFAAMILLQLGDIVVRYAGWHQAPLGAALVAVVVLVAFGFARGFGLRAAIIFIACVCALAAAALIAYVRVVNVLTLMAIVIIAHAAARSGWRNAKAWMGIRREEPPSSSDHTELTSAPLPGAARNS